MNDFEKHKRFSFEYKFICDFYYGMKEEGSGVPCINRIDSGLSLMWSRQQYWFMDTANAYCIYPIFQSDASFKKIFTPGNRQYKIRGFGLIPSVLAMECKRVSDLVDADILASSTQMLPEVREMLIVDKVQEKRNFETHNIEKSDKPVEYFNHWMNFLGIDDTDYKQYCDVIKQYEEA